MKQGQSKSTPLKERHFKALFEINMKAVFSIQDDWGLPRNYTHFDLNCGCGFNHAADCDGSPLAFISAVNSSNHGAILAHFVDTDRSAIVELRQRLRDYKWARCYNENNAAFLNFSFPGLVHRKTFGSILLDPNRFEFPVDELKCALSYAPFVDLIINVGFTPLKRVYRFNDAASRVARLLSLKEHWLIRKTDPPQQWSILVGRNTDRIRDWTAQGFFKLSSRKGFSILEDAITTAEARSSNPGFYVRELRRILEDAGVSCAPEPSDAATQLEMLPLWSEGNRGASLALPAVGTVGHS